MMLLTGCSLVYSLDVHVGLPDLRVDQSNTSTWGPTGSNELSTPREAVSL